MAVYVIENATLTTVSQIRDLGVLLDPVLSLDNHVDYLTTKVFASLEFLKWIRQICDIPTH